MKEEKKQPSKTLKPLKKKPYKESIGYLYGKNMLKPPKPGINKDKLY